MIDEESRSGEDLSPSPLTGTEPQVYDHNPFSETTKTYQSDAEQKTNSFLIRPRTDTAQNQLDSLKAELRRRCGAVFQGRKIDGNWVGPCLYAIPSNKRDDLLTFLKENNIPLSEVDLPLFLMQPPSLQKAQEIEMNAKIDRDLSTKLEFKKKEIAEEFERRLAQGEIDKEECEKLLKENEMLYRLKIQEAQDRADRNESAAINLLSLIHIYLFLKPIRSSLIYKFFK